MKYLYSLFIAFSIPGIGIAQSESDALKYSYRQIQGTPRVLGMGGSGSSMGSDLFSLISNPAGLAQSRNNQYLLSLGLVNTSYSSFYINEDRNASKTNLALPALGASFTTILTDRGKEVKTGLVSYTLGFSVQRSADYNRKMTFSGMNSSSSILDHFANLATGYTTDDLNSNTNGIANLAWQNYLIDYDPSGDYYYASLSDTLTIHQQNITEESGRKNNFNFAFGANISHVIYLGATVSFNTLRLENKTNWTEKTQTVYNPARSMGYDYGYTSTGTGGQFTLGMIVRPNDNIRLGVSYNSGSRYSMNDEYYYKMSSTNFPSQNSYYEANSELLNFNYTLKTPQYINTGLSVIFEKVAILNVDVDVINYANSRLNSDYYAFASENNSIRSTYRNTTNIKTGMEFLAGIFRFRGGFAYYMSPLKNNLVEPSMRSKLDQKTVTAGLGIKTSSGFFMDLAVLNTWYSDFYTPYQLNSETRQSYTAVNDVKRTQIVFGIGSYF